MWFKLIIKISNKDWNRKEYLVKRCFTKVCLRSFAEIMNDTFYIFKNACKIIKMYKYANVSERLSQFLIKHNNGVTYLSVVCRKTRFLWQTVYIFIDWLLHTDDVVQCPVLASCDMYMQNPKRQRWEVSLVNLPYYWNVKLACESR